MKLKKDLELILKGEICPYCNCGTEIVLGKDIFQGTFKYSEYKFFRCIQNKDHYVGTYATGRSFGRLADSELRMRKRQTHEIFDSLWNSECALFKSRFKAYKWLSSQMGLPLKLTHIGMFDIAQCDRAIQFCESYIANNSSSKCG